MDDSSPKSRTAKLQKLIREKGKNRLLNLERVIAILNNLSEYDFTDNDVLLLKEKLQRLTNKKVFLEDIITPDALVYPNDVLMLINDNSKSKSLTSFDKEQIRTLVFKAMADGKMIKKRDVDLFVNIYINNLNPLN